MTSTSHRDIDDMRVMPMMRFTVLQLDLIFGVLLLQRKAVRQKLGAVRRRRVVHHVWIWFGRLWRRWRGFGHGPHVHSDGPVRLDHCLPDLWQDDLAIGSYEVVVAFVHVGADDIDVEEGLLDEFFHALWSVSVLLLEF